MFVRQSFLPVGGSRGYERALERIDASGEAPRTITKLRAYVLRARGEIVEAQRLIAGLAASEATDEAAEELVLEARLRLSRRDKTLYRNLDEDAEGKQSFELV